MSDTPITDKAYVEYKDRLSERHVFFNNGGLKRDAPPLKPDGWEIARQLERQVADLDEKRKLWLDLKRQLAHSDNLIADIERQLQTERKRIIGVACSKHDLISSVKCAACYADLERQLAEVNEKYNDLLYQVANKIPGESRHETAKRIIYEHENKQCNRADAAIGKSAVAPESAGSPESPKE